MSQTNEMINLPIVNVAPVGDSEYHDEMPSDDYDSITIGAPTSSCDPSCVSVWAESITPVSPTDGGIAVFDVVLSVGIRSEDGMTSKTYKVVKRIGMDKVKLASQAECSAPVSIVEQQKVDDAKATAKRFRRLAGLE